MLKKISSVCFFLLVFGFAQSQVRYTPEQKTIIESKTKLLFEEMVEMAKKRQYPAFAKHMIYNGRNPHRNMQAKLNYTDPFDRVMVENTLHFLRNDIKKSALWHATTFKILQGFDKEVFIWEVEFTTLKGKVKARRFVFAQLKGEFLLARIEK